MDAINSPPAAPRRRKNPFIVLQKPERAERRPPLALHDAVKKLIRESGWLAEWTASLVNNMVIVDAAPRHDSILDDETLEKICRNMSTLQSLWRVERELILAVENMRNAHSKVRSRFVGEQRRRTEDRVARHLQDSETLLAQIQQEIDEYTMPFQPFKIRQELLAPYILDIAALIEVFVQARTYVEAANMGAASKESFALMEGKLRAVKRRVCKLRDNPSQKMTMSIKACRRELQRLCDDLERFNQQVMALCRSRGYRFFNRCGPVN